MVRPRPMEGCGRLTGTPWSFGHVVMGALRHHCGPHRKGALQGGGRVVRYSGSAMNAWEYVDFMASQAGTGTVNVIVFWYDAGLPLQT